MHASVGERSLFSSFFIGSRCQLGYCAGLMPVCSGSTASLCLFLVSVCLYCSHSRCTLSMHWDSCTRGSPPPGRCTQRPYIHSPYIPTLPSTHCCLMSTASIHLPSAPPPLSGRHVIGGGGVEEGHTSSRIGGKQATDTGGGGGGGTVRGTGGGRAGGGGGVGGAGWGQGGVGAAVLLV